MPAKNIKNITIYWIRGESFQNPILSFLDENPPDAILLIELLIASNKLIPANFNSSVSNKVSPTYISHNLFAVSLILGWILSPVIPGASAEKSCIPPIPRRGSIAIAKTIIPIPPNQCVILLQKIILSGRDSISFITVDPVVV